MKARLKRPRLLWMAWGGLGLVLIPFLLVLTTPPLVAQGDRAWTYEIAEYVARAIGTIGLYFVARAAKVAWRNRPGPRDDRSTCQWGLVPAAVCILAAAFMVLFMIVVLVTQ